jgi:NADH-quinone oxidoreductase subunit L
MLNNALYKCCLFLTGGSVERQTGTTDLEKLGGIGNKMPVTFACFLITAAAISGVPPFNGFISKELIYDAAIERGKIFYLAALAGSFLTAASFLKLGHAAFLGRRNKEHDSVKEVPAAMLFPMIIIAGLCVLFGTWSALPINAFFRPVLGADPTAGHEFGGFPKNMTLVSLSVITLIAALMNHIYGVKRTGKGVKAADHIHYAPGLSFIYDKAEKRWFDPYDIGLKMVKVVSETAWLADRAIDWVYNVLTVKVIYAFTYLIRRLHNGSHKVYIAWSVLAAFVVILFLIR